MAISDKKNWARPELVPLDRGVFARHWSREKLVEVRQLVQDALDLVAASEGAPEATAQLRATLAEIDASLVFFSPDCVEHIRK